MKFSIIIPVYNVEAYLDGCIESVLKQTYKDLEVILVDDGATDGSGVICDFWAGADLRVRVFHQKNAGASAARNLGLKHATGDVIFFLDADDYWLSDLVLEKVFHRLTVTKADVLTVNFQKIYEKRRADYFSNIESMPTDLEAGRSFSYLAERGLWISAPWNKAIQRHLFDGGALRFREGIVSEDIDWCLRLAMMAERFDFIDLQMVGYCQRTGSVSGSMTVEKTAQLCANVKECVRLLDQASPDKIPLLRPYVGYQYGTLIYNVAALPASQSRDALCAELRSMRHLLKWSDDPKIRMIRAAERTFGVSITLRMLALMVKITRIHKRRRG